MIVVCLKALKSTETYILDFKKECQCDILKRYVISLKFPGFLKMVHLSHSLADSNMQQSLMLFHVGVVELLDKTDITPNEGLQ